MLPGWHRLGNKLNESEKAEIKKIGEGISLKGLISDLVGSLNPDRHVEQAKQAHKTDQPNDEQVRQAATDLIGKAAAPLYNPDLRNLLIELHRETEQTVGCPGGGNWKGLSSVW